MLDKTFAYLQFVSAQAVPGELDPPLREAAMGEVKQLRSLPEIVLLAGSARFQQAFSDCAYRMALEGKIVLGKHVFKPGREWPLDERDKDVIHAVQFRMCEIADRLHVVNIDGYIGQDTYNLIKHAIRRELPITFQEGYVRLLRAENEKVTAHHFLQATKRTVSFEMAAL